MCYSIEKTKDVTALLDSYRKMSIEGQQFESLVKNKLLHRELLADLCQFYEKETPYLLQSIL